MTCDTIQSIYNELYYRHFIYESIYNQKSAMTQIWVNVCLYFDYYAVWFL